MKPSPDPLDRLFRAAARAPRAPLPATPFAVEAGVLAGLRRARAGEADEWFAFLPLFRAGLAVAACLALLALVVSLRPDTQPEADESIFLTPVLELTYLPVIALTKTKVIAYLAAIFTAGVLAGGVGGYALGRPRAWKPPPPPDPKGMAQHTLDRLETRLKLTPGQVGKIRGIVEQSFADAQYRSSTHSREMGEVFRKMNAQITEHLNPDQKAEFERMEKERRDKMRGWGRSKAPSAASETRNGTNCPPGERGR